MTHTSEAWRLFVLYGFAYIAVISVLGIVLEIIGSIKRRRAAK